MKLLIISELNSHIAEAGKIAFDRGSQVTYLTTLEDALDHLRQGKGGDLVLVNVTLDVASFILSLQQERIMVPVIACGIGNNSRLAVDAIKAGAKDYLPLPPEPDLIAAILEAVSGEQHDLIFRDPKMEKITEMAKQIALSDASVLITGESGTGKEIMARFIHTHSRRKDKPFVSVNCAAIPDNLLESELFGHEKGAFTGAIARRIGKFEEANGGTLLLDEIGEMHPRLQAKLLRAIQERTISRVGGNQMLKVDIRLLSTTNRDLPIEIQNGNFREDLFYRLNVINLNLPPLRDRLLDIESLAQYFTTKYCLANGVPDKSLTAEVMVALKQQKWRGNVRELENCIHRAILLSGEGMITSDHIVTTYSFAPATASPQQPASSDNIILPDANSIDHLTNGLVGRKVEDVERHLILNTLNHCLGNRTQTANILGISIRTLRNKLRLYTGGEAS